MEKTRNLFRSFLPIIFLFILQNVASIVAVEMIFPFLFREYGMSGIMKHITSEAFITEVSMWTSFLYTLAGIPLLALAYVKLFYDKENPHFYKDKVIAPSRTPGISLRGFTLWKLVLGLLLMPVAILMISNAIIAVVSVLVPSWVDQMVELQEMSGIGESMSPIMILYVVLLGPILEELAFRGVTMEFLKRAGGMWMACILQAVLFGAMHMNPLQATYAAVLGFVYGYVYIKTGNILLTILLHIMNNGITFFMQDLSASGGPVVFFLIVMTSLCAVYGGMLLVKSAAPKEENQTLA